MRVAIGGFMQETNSFSPVPTTTAEFEAEYLVRGDDILGGFEDTNSEIAGFLAACGAAPAVEVVPLLAAAANSGGELKADAFAEIGGELIGRLRAAQSAGPLAAVLLALHGSMCAEGEHDPDGAILTSVRKVVGPGCIVASSLDLHANVTERMAAAADVLVGYRTYPHVDQRRTGERAAGIALAAARGGPRPRTVVQKLPLIVPAENMQTTHGPMHELRAEAYWLEAEGAASAVSVFGVQPWLDVQDAGCSAVVVATEAEDARRLAARLAEQFWRRRRDFAVDLVDVDTAVRRALAIPRGPVILVDSADCPSSGAPGDSTAALRAMLDAGLGAEGGDLGLSNLCLAPVVDAAAAAACHNAGLGAPIRLSVGGKLDPARSQPVQITGLVERLTDGRFIRKGPGFTGLPLDAGPSAVIATGVIRLLVLSRAVPTSDPELYRAAGLRPETARIVVVKSPNQFRAAYAALAREIILLDTPGAASANLRTFAWRRIGRPIYPLDDFEWRAEADGSSQLAAGA